MIGATVDDFVAEGYVIGKDPDMEDLPNAFLPTNERGNYFADVYPVAVGEHGEIALMWGTELTARGRRRRGTASRT